MADTADTLPSDGRVNSDEKINSDKPDDVVEPMVGTKLVLLLISLSLGCFLILLDTSIVATAIPKITDEFHSLSDVGWYGSAYLLGR